MFGLLGCIQPQTRLQAPDDAELINDVTVQTIGEVTSYANADPIHVSGVGIVTGLDGTGGDAPPGSYRTLLEKQLYQMKLDHVKEILACPDNSMVLVSALIPPGAHKGDLIDIEVSLPPFSKTISLRGGYLKPCSLYNYDSSKNLNPAFEGPDRLVLGHLLARGEGPLTVGFDETDNPDSLIQAKVWSGARSNIDRPLYLVVNPQQQSGPMVQRLAQRINQTFHGPFRGSMGEVAEAKTKAFLVLKVPLQYRYNLPRFMRVVRLIPWQEAPAPDSLYGRKLARDLANPARAVTAALRLEALGNQSVAALKQGLQSTHTLVRFAAAEALAYLGNPAGGDELARLIESQPHLRAYCLTALTSLDESISHVKLGELLASADTEVRYGAFRALRALDEHDPAVQGELLNDSFCVHRVARQSPPLVHICTSRRAEVVLFGDGIEMIPPFPLRAGEFTITAAANDTKCTISRVSKQYGTARKQCSLRLDDVLRTMADMGGLYNEVVEFLQQAGELHCLNCSVAVDALPQATSVYDLAKEDDS
jgi:hypothetical protein